MPTQVNLTQGKVAIVDETDLPLLAGHKWHHCKGYAQTNIRHPNRRGQTRLKMHRFLRGLVYGDPRFVDHINGNGLDNRQVNLRVVTPKQNSLNQKRHREGRLVGACFTGRKLAKPWKSFARVGKRTIALGYFRSEQDAHNRFIQVTHAH